MCNKSSNSASVSFHLFLRAFWCEIFFWVFPPSFCSSAEMADVNIETSPPNPHVQVDNRTEEEKLQDGNEDQDSDVQDLTDPNAVGNKSGVKGGKNNNNNNNSNGNGGGGITGVPHGAGSGGVKRRLPLIPMAGGGSGVPPGLKGQERIVWQFENGWIGVEQYVALMEATRPEPPKKRVKKSRGRGLVC